MVMDLLGFRCHILTIGYSAEPDPDSTGNRVSSNVYRLVTGRDLCRCDFIDYDKDRVPAIDPDHKTACIGLFQDYQHLPLLPAGSRIGTERGYNPLRHGA
jgi:hypothetical protein